MAAFGAVTILMDTLHQHFLQPTPRFPLRNKTKAKLLYKNLSSLRTSLEQDFKVGERDEAVKALEAQMRDVSVELRFQIEEELRLFYLGKSMKLRLHSAQKLLPILNGAIKGGIETMDFNSVMEILGKHFTLPVSGMPPHIYKRVKSFCRQHQRFLYGEPTYLFIRERKSNDDKAMLLYEAESVIRQELRASYLNKYMKQRIQATQRIRQLFIQGISLTSNIKKEMLKELRVYGYSSCEPLDIWGLPQLKNITISDITLVPPRSVHHNLESIRGLDYRSCTKELFLRIPNLRILEVTSNYRIKCKSPNWFESLVYLYKVEVLMVKAELGKFSTIYSMGMLSLEKFLPNLKELNLSYTILKWKDMDVIGKLSKLEHLTLDIDAVKDHKWEPKDGGFCQLKFLKILQTGLQCWEATSDHFPVLEDLVLSYTHIKEIPSDFVDITTLKSIKLVTCLESLISSAECIQKQRQEYGDDTFVVDISRLYGCSKSVISSAKCIQEKQQEYGNNTFVVDILRLDF
nr:putative disease resistance RPP13-like protein 3 [Ipomoea batatas]